MFPLLTMETRAKPLEVRIFAGFARGCRSEMPMRAGRAFDRQSRYLDEE